jgi:hypothetical protein
MGSAMTRVPRARLARIALVVAGLASLATSPSPPSTVVSTGVNEGLALTPASPTLVRHVVARIKPGDLAEATRAEVYVDWTAAGAKPIDIIVVRDADGAPVALDPLPETITAGHLGGSFAPFASCNSGESCEARFTVTFQLVARDQVLTIWSFVVHRETGSPVAASSTTIEATIAP